MARYGLFFRGDTNKPVNLYLYRENEFPPVEAYPKDGSYFVTFDENTPNYDLIYGVLVDDKEKIYGEYDSFNTTYDVATNTFTFVKKSIPSVIDQIRIERDRRLAFTDELMFAPDYPDDIKQALLDYRQALRDITKNLPAGADVLTAPWPELPSKLITINPDHLSGDHNPI